MKKIIIDIVWFKRDLRIFDHTPLSLASESGRPILPIFIFEPELWKGPDHSYRQYIFLKEALRDLDKQLSSLGANLVILVGNAVDIYLIVLIMNTKLTKYFLIRRHGIYGHTTGIKL